MRSITVPAGYAVSDEYFGWEDDQSQKGLWLVFAVGLALVVLTVAMVFDSAWGAAMVFLSLPIALGGVVVAFWLTRYGVHPRGGGRGDSGHRARGEPGDSAGGRRAREAGGSRRLGAVVGAPAATGRA